MGFGAQRRYLIIVVRKHLFTASTDEAKAKISATRTGAKNWKAQRVLCVETGVTYPCVRDAYRETGVHFSGISKVCLGKGVTAGGYHWKYID